LRADFEQRMERLLGPEELGAFLASFEDPPVRGLRLNPAKVDAAELGALLGVALDEPVPWAPGAGFLLPAEAPPLGLHPAIDCGLFYLQDPASMLGPAVLDPEAGWRVADVAAAPGGKATDLASRVGPGGLLLANEVVRPRLKLLESAIERWGSARVATSSLDLERLPGPYDGVLLDAPCTGEALFRRERDSARGWSDADVRGNAKRQARLLDAAARLVRPGGVLVYSTCSFELAEDEDQVAGFLDRNEGWELDDALIHPSLAGGIGLDRTARIWPHRAPGNGQFVARLVLCEGDSEPPPADPPPPSKPDRATLAEWHAFREATVPGFEADDSAIVVRGDTLYLVPEHLPGPLSRPGLPLGRRRPGRFEPSHALATAIDARHAAQTEPHSAEYLRGETTPSPGPDRWVLVTYERWGLGWARRSKGVLKNFFPKSQRRQR
jgi:16S rRNA C967 or C1407 C5-methylase (RsmB/RsmF family)/NOL1/NOP2/fmu family ribosome biogenesis protein